MWVSRLQAFLAEPLRGKTSLWKVIWLYTGVGSLGYLAIEFFLDPNRVWLMRLYIILGLIFSIYVTIASYQCAGNCRSPWVAKMVRISAIVTLLLLPVATYLELTGSLSLSQLEDLQLPE